MRWYRSIALLVVSLFGPTASALLAEEAQVIELAIPRPPDRGEALQIQITTGPLPRGARLALIAENGETLGALAPFPPGSRLNTATVPVPRSAISAGQLRMRLQVIEPGAPPRSPRSGEIRRLDLAVVPQTE
jgi:hypothetical protein